MSDQRDTQSPVEALVRARRDALDQLSKQERLGFPPRAIPQFSPEAWFLGPKAENRDVFERLILEAIASHVQHRQEFHVEDPDIITSTVRDQPSYRAGVRRFEQEARTLFQYLKWSAPVASMRHQGHMLWDQVMPAMVGYFAGMLYNQNNVAAESSPVTTLLEINVGDDLCRMLGLNGRTSGGATVPPWGHITCDGSVANIEAMWAARNAKLFPLALKRAVGGPLAAAAGLEVATAPGARARLADLDAWQLLNIPLEEILAIPRTIQHLYRIEAEETHRAVAPFSVANIGLVRFWAECIPSSIGMPEIFVPSTRHYSWPKGATLLGLGKDAVRSIAIDTLARMDMRALEDALQDCLAKQVPVMAVVAVIGSTQESAVDPLAKILELRRQFRRQGLEFAVHCDAAWGGYFASMLRNPALKPIKGIKPPPADLSLPGRRTPGPTAPIAISRSPMSAFVREQLDAMSAADSITVDPHKAGYVPYPAGALCYGDSRMRDMVSLEAPVIYHSQTEPTVGIYGIEGSKPGAAAASVWLAHRVIRTTPAGYGGILERCMWNAIRLYCRLASLECPGLKLVPLIPTPRQRAGAGRDELEQERAAMREFARTGQEVSALGFDPSEWGPDLLINAFACNFADAPNDSLKLANELNARIFKLCSVTDPRDYRSNLDLELIITASQFDPAVYGRKFVDDFCGRLGVTPGPGEKVDFLICTSMDPWRTDAGAAGDFLQTLERAFCNAAQRAMKEVRGNAHGTR